MLEIMQGNALRQCTNLSNSQKMRSHKGHAAYHRRVSCDPHSGSDIKWVSRSHQGWATDFNPARQVRPLPPKWGVVLLPLTHPRQLLLVLVFLVTPMCRNRAHSATTSSFFKAALTRLHAFGTCSESTAKTANQEHVFMRSERNHSLCNSTPHS